MEKVKSAFEKAMEKIATVEVLSPEEKARIKEQEMLKSFLAGFFKGDIGRDNLWKKLKGSNPALLREAQLIIADSLRLRSLLEETIRRKDGILAIETLKEKKNTASVESLLKTVERLQKEYNEGKENAIEQLRQAIEKNPQLRMRPVKTPDGRTAYQPTVSVDEAVQARLAEFMEEHEKAYEEMFNKTVEKLKKELK